MNAGHVCIVTSAHPLDDVRVHTKFAESFLQNGWDVSWVGPDIALFDQCSQSENFVLSYEGRRKPAQSDTCILPTPHRGSTSLQR